LRFLCRRFCDFGGTRGIISNFERQRTADLRVSRQTPEWVLGERIDDLLTPGLGKRLVLALPIASRLAAVVEASGRAFAFRQRRPDRPDRWTVQTDFGFRGGFAACF
jgi:hypothetical protein